MKYYLLFLPQIALITLYDWIFFVNDYSNFSANIWWAFVFVHLTFVAEIVSICFLRSMKQMPLTKKHPMWLFTIVMGIQMVFATVFSLVQSITLKWVIILSSIVFLAELASLGVLYLVQKRRDKKAGVTEEPKADEPEDDEEEEPTVEVEEELPPPPPKKIKSSAVIILMKFLADPSNWDVPEGFKEIDQLTEAASTASQYTYEELSEIEDSIKEQTNALKAYLQNDSIPRAKTVLYNIIDLLEEREAKIDEIENN